MVVLAAVVVLVLLVLAEGLWFAYQTRRREYRRQMRLRPVLYNWAEDEDLNQ